MAVGIGRNVQGFPESKVGTREGLGNHEAVPGVCFPAVAERDVKADQRYLGVACQQHRPGLGNIHGTARAVDGKGDAAALFEFGVHAQQGADAATGTRSAHRTEAEPGAHAGNRLPVEAAAGHHLNLAVAEDPRGWKDAAMPEDVDTRTRRVRRFHSIFRRDGAAHGTADGTDG